MRAIAARVDDEMRGLAAGQPLQYRLHVDCSSRFISAARPPQGPAPAILAAFGSDVESVKVAVESCTVKVLWKFLDREERTPHMRAYSVSLPLESTGN
jgi:alkanesulfonate monooxygenase SsuD/methylene tetrahydromethanopterin reductase-like flavin-dependent oxidoreductase (luciferase family)